MINTVTDDKVPQRNDYVKSTSPASMIHHNVITRHTPRYKRGTGTRIILRKGMSLNHYGVSRSQRILSPQIMLKRLDRVRECLDQVIRLPSASQEVTMRLLRYWSYYGNVYPKESTITTEPGCSKASYWRTIKILEASELIKVVNRFRISPHAQISNLYLLHGLIVVIARYLAEHGQRFKARWISPFLTMPGAQFWAIARKVGVEGIQGALFLPGDA